MAHSYFFQDALRGSISRKVGCVNPMQPKGSNPNAITALAASVANPCPQ